MLALKNSDSNESTKMKKDLGMDVATCVEKKNWKQKVVPEIIYIFDFACVFFAFCLHPHAPFPVF